MVLQRPGSPPVAAFDLGRFAGPAGRMAIRRCPARKGSDSPAAFLRHRSRPRNRVLSVPGTVTVQRTRCRANQPPVGKGQLAAHDDQALEARSDLQRHSPPGRSPHCVEEKREPSLSQAFSKIEIMPGKGVVDAAEQEPDRIDSVILSCALLWAHNGALSQPAGSSLWSFH